MNTQTTTVTKKGQVTIPQEIREKSGIEAGDQISFEYREGRKEVVLKSVKDFLSFAGFFKTSKKYNKKVVEEAIIKSILKERVKK